MSDKVLVIRKPDRTIHQVPLANKARLMSFNNRLPAGQQWSFEEMDAAKAAKLPFIDKDFVTAGEAVSKLKDLETMAEQKDARIAELEKMLAAKNSGSKTDDKTLGASKPEETAVEKIAKIQAAKTEAEVKELLGDDSRKTVTDAATKQIASFEAK